MKKNIADQLEISISNLTVLTLALEHPDLSGLAAKHGHDIIQQAIDALKAAKTLCSTTHILCQSVHTLSTAVTEAIDLLACFEVEEHTPELQGRIRPVITKLAQSVKDEEI